MFTGDALKLHGSTHVSPTPGLGPPGTTWQLPWVHNPSLGPPGTTWQLPRVHNPSLGPSGVTHSIVSTGLSLVETLKLFKKKSTDCLETVNEHNLSLYSDFFFRTFMQHYKLYQWVYLNQRQLSLNQITLTVSNSNSLIGKSVVGVQSKYLR